MRRHLIIFARAPRLGVGKRRLAADIGDVAALRFQRTTLAQVIRRLGDDGRWRCWLAVTPPRGGAWPRRFDRVIQPKGELGARMRAVAGVPPVGPVVLIGADIPDVQPHHIARAFQALGRHDMVFGPAGDGGFWLVGWRRSRRRRPIDPFAGVRWSTPHALADTLANARRYRVGLVDTLDDIDDGAASLRHRQSRG